MLQLCLPPPLHINKDNAAIFDFQIVAAFLIKNKKFYFDAKFSNQIIYLLFS